MTTALVDIKERIKQEIARMANTVPVPSGRYITCKGKVFTLPDGRSSQGPISAVILDWRNYNAYYKNAWNPNVITGPACYALSSSTDLAPGDDVQSKQSDSCDTCKWNEFGSAANGGRGKACRNFVRIAIASPDSESHDDPMIIRASPTAISRWSSYISGFASIGKHPIELVTQIGFDPNQTYPTLTFAYGDPLDDQSAAIFWTLREKAQAILDAAPKSDTD